MAKKNMTFSVSLNLLTRQFNKGIKAVQNSLRSLRAQFQTFVGGIGVGLGFQELIDNAKSLDKVQTTLRNVSGSYDKYGENMKFIQGLSKKYNQDLITLTGNYAKFYSAASYAGFALEEQQHIYESLTRASAYFNLTADETNGVMLAIQQMISKGRVSSEELRRQLGERLPGAMNLAAVAAGKAGITVNGTTAELEEMIKEGKVLAKDLLPALAKELDGLTQNFNVDTIQGATAKLKNSFTELVQKLKVGDIYKGFLNGVSSGLDYINKNLKSVVETIGIVIGTLSLKGSFSGVQSSWEKFFKKIETNLKKVQTETKILIKKYEDGLAAKGLSQIRQDKKTGMPVFGATGKELSEEDLDEIILKTRELLKLKQKEWEIQEQLNSKVKTYMGHLKQIGLQLLKTIGIQAAYYAISAAISAIVVKLASWVKEQKRIKNLVKDTNEEFDKLSNKIGVDEGDLTATKDRYLKKNKDGSYVEDEKTRILLLARINKLLGLTGENELKISDSEEKINKAIEDRLALYKKEREYQAARQTLTDAENRKKELENKKAAAQANADKFTELLNKESKSKTSNSDLVLYYGRQVNKYTKEIKTIDKELVQLNTVINNFSDKVAKLGLGAEERQSVLENTNPEPITDPEELKKLQEEYDKIQKEHNNKLRALNEQLADEVITKEDYDKALKDLYTSTLESIYSLDNVNENTDSFAKSILDRVKGFEANKVVEDKAEKALYEYYTKTLELANQLDDGLLTYEEYQDALVDLKEETLKNLSAMGELSDAAEQLAASYEEQRELQANQKKYNANKEAADLINSEIPTLGSRDTFFDYKKQDSEKFDEMVDIYNDYVDKLNDLISKIEEIQAAEPTSRNADMLEDLNNLLEQATQNADTFAQAAKFAEVQEDVKNLKQELNEGIWDNITGIATAAERLTNSFKSLQETWDDPDASGWEKFITTFTTIISVIETIVSVVKTFNSAMKVAEALSLATAAAEGAQIPVKTADAIATKAQAAAAKELAVARHLAASASVPYPANIAAIASTSAALAAAFAAIPKFAHGGYVKGNSTHGDKVLARLNSGELVLNKGQQATLFNLLNGKGGLGGNGNVEFKIKGTELVGVLNNYSKKISK